MKKLYVGNLNYATTEDKLKEIFGSYGTVTSCNVIPGRGFGFVEMEQDDAALAARDALNGTELEGRKIKVDEAKPKKEFGGGGGGRPEGGGSRFHNRNSRGGFRR